MPVLAAAIGLSLVGSIGGMLVASGILYVRDETRTRLVATLISFAVGTMLAASLLRLLPEALEQLPAQAALGSLLGGVRTFFVLEKLVLWRHCHETGDCAVHNSAASLVIVGDAFHTFVDGAIIGAAALTSIPLGVTAAIAAAAHEVPQEIADFAVLVRSGLSPRRAVLLNFLSGLSALAGVAACFVLRDLVEPNLPFFLTPTSGMFVYIPRSTSITC